LLALSDSGIRTARDLRGRRLGLPLRTGELIDMARATALRGYLSVLEHNGMSYRDVDLVDVVAHVTELRAVGQSQAFVDQPQGHRNNRGYAADVRALLQRDVDVIYVKGVRGVEVARQLGDRAIVAVDIAGNPDTRWRSNNATPRPITVSNALLREQPELVARLLRQIVAVGPWAEQQQRQALELLSLETGSPGEWVNFAYGIDLRLATDLSESNIAALEEFKDFLFQWDFLPDNFSVREWIDFEPLQQVLRARRKSA
jgi:ABC-type nitrate/sulfonate/bicarbonate transport system substrate-binding protein